MEDFAADGLYSQVWHMLMKEGLTGGGEHAEAMVELRRIRAKLDRRAAQSARKEQRKKRKKARRQH
jgi:hypothetical protein